MAGPCAVFSPRIQQMQHFHKRDENFHGDTARLVKYES